jgi:hypothetical protein
VAAAAVFLARLILNPAATQAPQWKKDFEELTGYKHTDLILVIESLYMMNPDPRFDVLTFLQDEFTTGKSSFSVCRPFAVGRRTALIFIP